MLHLTTPACSFETAKILCRELFGLSVTVSHLPSYKDINFAVADCTTNNRFVLKLAHPDVDAGMLDLENEAMRQLAGSNLSIRTPEPVPALTGTDIVPVAAPDGLVWHVRLVTFLAGRLWSDMTPAPPARLHALGVALGEIDTALMRLEHPQLQRDVSWSIHHAPEARSQLPLIDDNHLRKTLEGILDHFDMETRNRLTGLPRTLIHNDANDNNLIVDAEDGRLSGLVDFGDMVYSWKIAELAVTAAYVCTGWDDPVAGICHVISGYNEISPLDEAELTVLRDLILMRLVQSLCNSAEAQKQAPDNSYIAVSEEDVKKLLWKLLEVSPAWTCCQFREACGREAVPDGGAIRQWLRTHGKTMSSVVDVDLRHCRKLVYDFAEANAGRASLEGDQREQTQLMFGEMDSLGIKVGVGRYREDRRCYRGPQFAAQGEPRSVHLGIDLFMPAGKPVFAPLAGTVHSFADNAQPFDYGPTIIIRHEPEPGILFYTLYGHLARESLAGLVAGQTVAAGERVGWIGDIDVNGGWIPHLHFQIVLDMLGEQGNFAGVGHPSKLAVWEGLCPDPNLILGMPESVKARVPWSRRAIQARRSLRMSSAQSTSYREPLKIVAGEGVYLIDENGNRYLDMVNNVCHVGHCHPRVVAAAQQQITRLNTNSRYLHDNLVDYSERLADMLPPHLSTIFFVNSGSEANDLALRLARTRTGRHDVGVVDHAYHGHLGSLIDISPYKYNGPGGRGAPAFVHQCPFPDPYRGPVKGDDPDSGHKYAEQAKSVLDRAQSRAGGNGLAAFIAESFAGVGGQIIWPAGYLREVFDHVRSLGGVSIADEVQVGFGRVGKAFWAFEYQGATPDIVTMGKPIGNGHPLAAVATTAEIAASFANGMEYFNTFGGNPVSCAVGLTVLDVIQDERLQDNARDVGAYLQSCLQQLQDRYAIIGDVRGVGLFQGVELVRDRATLEPADAEATGICEWLRHHGVLLSADGPFHNVLKIKPPITLSRAQADYFVELLEKSIRNELGLQ